MDFFLSPACRDRRFHARYTNPYSEVGVVNIRYDAVCECVVTLSNTLWTVRRGAKRDKLVPANKRLSPCHAEDNKTIL